MRLRSSNGSAARQSGVTIIEVIVAAAILGILAAVAIPQYVGYRERALRKHAIMDIEQMAVQIKTYRREFGALPIELSAAVDPIPTDPWGNPYEYLNLEAGLPGTEGMRRRDKNMNPINSDFDLYSKGPDGQSQAQLVAAGARDDIVRAADGGFVGVAEDF